MCNACHNMCCGSDLFEGCGCEHCDNPACWPEEDDDDEEYYERQECAAALPGHGVAKPG